MTMPNIDRRTARRLLKKLQAGTTTADGTESLHVGHEGWLAAQKELRDEVFEDDDSSTKFVKGAYGAGKSHFLVVMQRAAEHEGWATAHVECNAHEVALDKFVTLYKGVIKRLRVPGLAEDLTELLERVSDGKTEDLTDLLDRFTDGKSRDLRELLDRVADGKTEDLTELLDRFTDGKTGDLTALLDRFTDRILKTAGHSRARTMHAVKKGRDVRSAVEQRLIREANLPYQFRTALIGYVMASMEPDVYLQTMITDWLKGGDQVLELRENLLTTTRPSSGTSQPKVVRIKPIKEGTVKETMGGLLWLIKNAGYKGLVLCVDEVEHLANLKPKTRIRAALNELRRHVDSAGGDEEYNGLCLYLAATPDMFDNPDNFPSYDALQTRIQPLRQGERINFRGTVIDLEKTPLTEENMRTLTRNLRKIHQIARNVQDTDLVTDTELDEFLDTVITTKLRGGKPRLLTRLVIDRLENGPDSTQSPAERLQRVSTAAQQS
jgi:hypothetical protein